MKKLFQQMAVAAAALFALVLVLGWAGDIDYTEQVILHMSQQEYDTVRQYLTNQNGREPSESEIAHWWAKHHR